MRTDKPLYSVDDLISEAENLERKTAQETHRVNLRLWVGLVMTTFLIGSGFVITTYFSIQKSSSSTDRRVTEYQSLANESVSNDEIDILSFELPNNLALLVTAPSQKKLGNNNKGQSFTEIPDGVFGVEGEDNEKWVYLITDTVTGNYTVTIYGEENLETELKVQLSENDSVFLITQPISLKAFEPLELVLNANQSLSKSTLVFAENDLSALELVIHATTGPIEIFHQDYSVLLAGEEVDAQWGLVKVSNLRQSENEFGETFTRGEPVWQYEIGNVNSGRYTINLQKEDLFGQVIIFRAQNAQGFQIEEVIELSNNEKAINFEYNKLADSNFLNIDL